MRTGYWAERGGPGEGRRGTEHRCVDAVDVAEGSGYGELGIHLGEDLLNFPHLLGLRVQVFRVDILRTSRMTVNPLRTLILQRLAERPGGSTHDVAPPLPTGRQIAVCLHWLGGAQGQAAVATWEGAGGVRW